MIDDDEFVDDRDFPDIDADRCTICGATDNIERAKQYGKVIYLCASCRGETK